MTAPRKEPNRAYTMESTV